jgi:serine/threonine protein kinase
MRIGRYVLRERIDTGGEAQVWKAFNDGLPVAMKLRPAAGLHARDDVNELGSAFANEKEQWIEFTRSSLYIVHILDVLSEIIEDAEGKQWVVHGIVCEFSDIGDLQRAIENGALREHLKTEAHFIQFLLHLISGVKAGHDAQRFHCDIKPKNVLLFRDGGQIVPKLADFGIAGSALEPIKGFAPGYSAPELTTGVTPTAKSDIYSLGITFYDILYATLLKPATEIKTARAYKTGKEYKEYLREISYDATQSKFVVPYISLIASMASEQAANRPTLDQVAAMLESSQAKVFRDGPQYEVKTKPDTYLWNPLVHELLDEKLYYILVKGRNPAIDLREVITDLEHAGFTAFTVRSVFGEWDFIIRIWIPKSLSAPEAAGAASRGGRTCLLLEAVKLHLAVHRKSPIQSKTIQEAHSDVQLLKNIEDCAGSSEFEKLQKNGYVVTLLNRDPRSFRVTFLVSIHGFEQLTPVIGVLITDIIKNDRKAKEISFYETKPDRGQVRLIVNFIHTDFVECRATLLKVYAELVPQGDHFNFSTLWDMNAKNDRMSDDGTIIPRIRAAHLSSL